MGNFSKIKKLSSEYWRLGKNIRSESFISKNDLHHCPTVSIYDENGLLIHTYERNAGEEEYHENFRDFVDLGFMDFPTSEVPKRFYVAIHDPEFNLIWLENQIEDLRKRLAVQTARLRFANEVKSLTPMRIPRDAWLWFEVAFDHDDEGNGIERHRRRE